MDGFGNDFFLAFASLVAIINPLGVAFVFRRLTIWATPSERAQLSTRIAVYAMAVILGSYFFGRFVLGFFGITLPALRIAGGIIVALSGWQLLNRSEQPAAPEATNNASPVSMAFFPLTMPLTAGPGTITVAIALGAARERHWGADSYRRLFSGNARGRCDCATLLPQRRSACPTRRTGRGSGRYQPVCVPASLRRCPDHYCGRD